MQKIPVIIDCDGGIDSFWGLMLAKASPELDIRAVTVCAGKETPEVSFANVALYHAQLGLTARLVKGSTRSVLNLPKSVWGRYGSNGKCALPFAAKPSAYEAGYAWDVIREEAAKAGGELTILCFGPMTNLALTLYKHLDILPLIKRVVFVGGSYDFGNYSSVVEINMATDPEAARTVFRSGVELTMIGYNAERQSAFSDEQVRTVAGDKGYLLGEAFIMSALAVEKTLGSIYYGPALAVASLVSEQVAAFTHYHVTIENKSSLCRGRTTPLNMYAPRGFVKNTYVAMQVNMDQYVRLLQQAILKLSKK